MSFTIDTKGRRLPVSRWGHVSASQLKTADLCMRKWAFEKVWGVRTPSAYHHDYGKALHDVGERYMAQVVTSWDDLFPASWARNLLPKDREQIQGLVRKAVEQGVWRARQGLIVEHPIALLVGRRMRDHRGMPLVARALTYQNDVGVRAVARLLSMHDGSPLPIAWDDLPPLVGFVDIFDLWAQVEPIVEDHKTAKNTRYVLTAEDLTDDIQMLSYAASVFGLRPDVDRVRVRHNVFVKDPQEPNPVFATEAVVTVDQVRRKWDWVVDVSERMQLIRTLVKDQPVDPTKPEHRADAWHRVPGAVDEEGGYERACKAYGGCAFQDACKRRCTAAQVVQRVDTSVRASTLLAHRPAPSQSFKLNFKNHTNPTPKE